MHKQWKHLTWPFLSIYVTYDAPTDTSAPCAATLSGDGKSVYEDIQAFRHKTKTSSSAIKMNQPKQVSIDLQAIGTAVTYGCWYGNGNADGDG